MVISVSFKDCIHCYPRALLYDIPRVRTFFNNIPGSGRSLTILAEKMYEGELFHGKRMTCICDHPGLNSVCLDQYGLEAGWLAYSQHYGSKAFEGPQDVKYMHIAYIQLDRWCWGYIGSGNRVIIPACVVSCIRTHFPVPREEDNFTFKGFRPTERTLPNLH